MKRNVKWFIISMLGLCIGIASPFLIFLNFTASTIIPITMIGLGIMFFGVIKRPKGNTLSHEGKANE